MIGTFPTSADGFAAELEQVGGWGVAFFFVLSGFLLGRPYLRAVLHPPERAFPSTKRFLTRRFYRIVPLYVFAVAVTAFAAYVDHRHVSALNIALHLTFLHGFFPAYDAAPFGPLWTMAVDAQFYLTLPLLAYAVYAILRTQAPQTRLRGLVAVLIGTIVASVAFRYAMVLREPRVLADFDTSLVYVRNVVGMAASFSLGALLALAIDCGRRVGRRWHLAALVAGSALAILSCVLGVHGDPRTRMVFGDVLAAVSAVLLLWGSLEGRFPVLAWIARSPVTSTVAALSYAIYLLHKPLLVGVRHVFDVHGHLRTPLDIALMCAVTAILLGIAAAIAHHLVEKPLLRERDRHRESEPAPRTRVAAAPPAAAPAVVEKKQPVCEAVA